MCVFASHREKEEKKPSKLAKYAHYILLPHSTLFYFIFFPRRLASYRWVVPAHGQRRIKLKFSSKECGQFDHTFNFEIAGTRQRYQLFCRGQCHVPSITRDPQYASCRNTHTHICTYYNRHMYKFVCSIIYMHVHTLHIRHSCKFPIYLQ